MCTYSVHSHIHTSVYKRVIDTKTYMHGPEDAMCSCSSDLLIMAHNLTSASFIIDSTDLTLLSIITCV